MKLDQPLSVQDVKNFKYYRFKVFLLFFRRRNKPAPTTPAANPKVVVGLEFDVVLGKNLL